MKIGYFFTIDSEKNTNKYSDFINNIDTSSVNSGFLTETQHLEGEFPSRANKKVLKNDILFSNVRPYLKHYYFFKDNIEHAIVSTGFSVIRKKVNANICVKFVYYFLSSNSIVEHLSSIAEASQSTFPCCNKYDIERIELPNIEISRQQKIADILSNYDDLIENNNKRIKLLEQMAQELYKEWFIHFRFPGYQKVKFENGVPKGWSYQKFQSVYTYIRGISYSSEEIECDDGVNLVNLKNINGFGGFRRDGTKKYKGKFNPDQIVKHDDLIMGVTDMTQDRRTVGYAALIPNIRGVISADLIKLISKIDNLFSYCMLKYGYYSLLFSQFGNGANVIHLKPAAIKNQKLLIPDDAIIKIFVKTIKPIFGMIDSLNEKNDNLIKQRDLLLPRLMNGSIELK